MAAGVDRERPAVHERRRPPLQGGHLLVVEEGRHLQRHALGHPAHVVQESSGTCSPPNSQITVRSLGSSAKHRPWSMP